MGEAAQPHREIELKWALSADGHLRLAHRLQIMLGSPRVLKQHNRFFDAADNRLRRNQFNLRLRLENERLIMTVKRKRADAHAGTHDHDEWEQEIDRALWPDFKSSADQARLPLPAGFKAVLAGAPLLLVGQFANDRREYRHGEELLCLDEVDFGARTDYELEIETMDPLATDAFWRKQLAEWSIDFKNEPASKFGRMLELK